MKSRHDMPFGAQLLESGGAAFRLWAPSAERIELELNTSRHTMHKLPQGWHEAHRPDATPGARYRFCLPNGLAVPDPASRLNPDDVHGPSELVDPLAYTWKDETWRGRPWHEAVIYELHVGTFTPEGTFTAAARRIEGLAQLGITAIELMPLADFPGQRGWGYDGVLPFAPDTAYGSPDELKALIDLAHAHGLMVLLDVVYNHFGPEGNYLHAYCPEFFNAAHQTPWGAAINFDGEHSGPVREFFVHNALYWVEEFHIDGLRLDAVHAIHDDSPEHIVATIARAFREGPGQHRQVHLVLENERNQAHRLERHKDDGDSEQALRCATAQWNDDFHHAAHVLLTGETDAHYDDFAQAPGDMLGRALAEGFAYQGEASRFREGRPHGEPSAHLPSTAFISFVQNHDQIGNRAFGERLHQLTDPRWLEAMYACLLLSPHVPMLFAGEEWAVSTPFLYFCDFGPELAAAVSAGRRAEFGRFAAFGDERERERIPDANALTTFTASQLKWDERDESPHRERLELVRTLLALRREHLMPRLAGHPGTGRYRFEAGVLRVEWQLGDGSVWHLMAHFGARASNTLAAPAGEVLYTHGVSANANPSAEASGLQLQPGAVRVTRVTGHG